VGSIIGGHGATSFDDTYSSIVTGTTTITVNGLNGDVVTGDIFAGSAGYGRVIGGTLVKLQALDVNDSIGKISGDSSQGNDAQSYVLGSRALVVTESKTTVG